VYVYSINVYRHAIVPTDYFFLVGGEEETHITPTVTKCKIVLGTLRSTKSWRCWVTFEKFQRFLRCKDVLACLHQGTDALPRCPRCFSCTVDYPIKSNVRLRRKSKQIPNVFPATGYWFCQEVIALKFSAVCCRQVHVPAWQAE